ncbi:HET-domain-containing protein [Microthyrium microscopicum]|uniref:HET-domain-containing protein n=1 Tax=Microthyrium microscopicum TaxID=703497 RepID=A0A6A6TVE0_9PEZI|nr:HET-domain-containing protein [Microthyrium microscopicum]
MPIPFQELGENPPLCDWCRIITDFFLPKRTPTSTLDCQSLVANKEDCSLCPLFYKQDRLSPPSSLRATIAIYQVSANGAVAELPVAQNQKHETIFWKEANEDQDLAVASRSSSWRLIPDTKSTCIQENGPQGRIVVFDECIPEQQFSARYTSSLDWPGIQNWLQTCDKSHSVACQSREAIELQHLQLIDCYNCDSLSISTFFQPFPKYVALSYVWGPSAVQDKSRRVDLCNDGIPKTIRHAIEISRKLGFQYLWVDCYCVSQQDTEAKQKTIHSMGEIYENAALTLIAAAGDDDEHGMVSKDLVACQKRPIYKVGDHYVTTVQPKIPKIAIATSKWSTRGWTYQEALLSRRKLVFTEEMIFFECRGKHRLHDPSLM